jgi:putative membrane protein
MKFLIRWLITAVALLVAVAVVPGITVDNRNAWIAVGVMAVILGFVNAFLRPILNFLSCGCIALTLGLFTLVINAFTLWLSSEIARFLNIGFYVDGFWAALFGGIIVSLVSWALSVVLVDKDRTWT